MPSEATDSARQLDDNGFVTIRKNPISRVGVFQYMGSSIGGDAIPDKVYSVYRPPESLADPECIESFKLLPFINDHEMLGRMKDGLTPAEKKGVHGITGEAVDFDGDVLYSDLKIFSETLNSLIDEDEKVDLSLGYRCTYEKQSGTYAGQSYDYIQRNLRGNHIALVDQARCNVAVLDGQQITLDHFDLNQEDLKMPITLDEADKKLTAQGEQITKLQTTLDGIAKTLAALDAKAKDADEEKDKDKKGEDADMESEGGEKKAGAKVEDEEDPDKKKKGEDADEDKEKDKKAMDAALAPIKSELEAFKKNGMKQLRTEIGAVNKLASQLEQHVGTFDHSEMTLDEVAAYGIEKLKITAPKGQERAALDGFLQAKAAPVQFQQAQDSAKASKGLDAYLAKTA